MHNFYALILRPTASLQNVPSKHPLKHNSSLTARLSSVRMASYVFNLLQLRPALLHRTGGIGTYRQSG
jgi:hypothetical protein